MKWIICIVATIWVLLIAALEIWKRVVPEKSKLALVIEIVVIVMGVVGVVVGIIRNTHKEPSKKQVEAEKNQDAERIAERVLSKFVESCPIPIESSDRIEEYKKYLIQGITTTKHENPEKILKTLIREEEEIDTTIKENIKDLIERNKQIVIFAGIQGELITALHAINKILDYSPEDSFAFRERGYINHRMGKIDEAEQDHLKSVELSRTDLERASSFISIGVFYTLTAKFKKAIEYLVLPHDIGRAFFLL